MGTREVERSHQNLYDILGVSRYATHETIQDAYREIARLYHPDSNFYSEIIEDPVRQQHLEFFRSATDAYKILSDRSKRKAYDSNLGAEVVGWEDYDDGEVPLSNTKESRPQPELVKARSWHRKSSSMHEIIQKHQSRKPRILLRVALAAPFVLVVIACLLLNFIEF